MLRPRLALLLPLTLGSGCLGRYDSSAADGGRGVEAGVALPLTRDFAVPTGRDRFDSEVRPILDQRCASCHNREGGVGPAFLKAPAYETIIAWPGFVLDDPAQSRLVAKGPHNGALWFNDAEMVRLLDWLQVEARLRPMVMNQRPETPRQKILIGGNQIPLLALGADFAGAAITFDAQFIGATLQLKKLTLRAGGGGLRIQHPLFVVWSEQVKHPDPVDSFATLDLTVGPGDEAPLGPGTLFLANVGALDELAVAFARIDKAGGGPRDGGVDGGPVFGACKAVGEFTARAQMPLLQRCGGCHAGGNGAATNALDLRKAGDLSMAAQATACNETRARVNLNDPPASALFLVTTPRGASTHPYKFNGDQNAWNGFVQSVSQWIAKEK